MCKTNYSDLENLVKELEKTANLEGDRKEEQIKILQKINEKLLVKYAIKVGELTIVPLWVEAYYYHTKSFPDITTHRSPKQQGRFGMLYQHAKTEINGGVDICLTDSKEYFLSILIKNALIDGKFYTQEKINGRLIETQENIESLENIIIEYHREGQVYHTQRIGLTNKDFKDLPLASLPINEIKNYPFDNKENIAKTYLDDLFIAEREKKCIELLGYRSKYVIGK